MLAEAREERNAAEQAKAAAEQRAAEMAAELASAMANLTSAKVQAEGWGGGMQLSAAC